MIEIPRPVKKTRIDHIVLRVNWTDKTTSILRIPGIEGEGAPILRNRDPLSGLLDTLLAVCTIMPGGNITITETGDAGFFFN